MMEFQQQPSVKFQFWKNFVIKISFSSCQIDIYRPISFSWEKIFFFRLRDVILTDARLYLIFEYLAMDLKKYFDCLGESEDMEVGLIKVNSTLTIFFILKSSFRLELHLSNNRCSSLLSLSSNHSSWFEVNLFN